MPNPTIVGGKGKDLEHPSPICRTGGERSGTTGSSLTKEQQSNLDALQRILKTQNCPVSTLAFVTFLDWPRRNVPDFPVTGSFDGTPPGGDKAARAVLQEGRWMLPGEY